MSRRKPIVVEIDIKTDLERLWKHTQIPELHQQWDLRFSEIDYLTKKDKTEFQDFRYRTRIGFGFDIHGIGRSKTAIDRTSGERISILRFASSQRISLIRQGQGYWRYIETPDRERITFATRFDYSTRFGFLGRIMDRWLFRPLFGYMTAWSFDRLRIWLEQRITPRESMKRALIHYMSVLLLILLWSYQGIVPKMLFPEAGELDLMKTLIDLNGMEREVLIILGLGELLLAGMTLLLHRRKLIYRIQVWLLLLFLLLAFLGQPSLFGMPFNPLTLTFAMIGLCMTASMTMKHLPNARRCRRKLTRTRLKEGVHTL